MTSVMRSFELQQSCPKPLALEVDSLPKSLAGEIKEYQQQSLRTIISCLVHTLDSSLEILPSVSDEKGEAKYVSW